MDIIYYIAIMLLIIGVPILLLFVLAAIFKPILSEKFLRRQWSRRRIGLMGLLSLIIAVIGLSSLIDLTMPESVRAEIAAQQKANETSKQTRQLSESRSTQSSKKEADKKPVTMTKVITEPVAFQTIERPSSSLPKGERKIIIQGVNGYKKITYKFTYVDGKQIAKKLIASAIAKQPTNKVISVGTYVPPAPAPQPKPAPAPRPVYVAPKPSVSYYENCSAARAAGVTPIYSGQPGYGTHLDRDKDGVACE